MARNSENIAGAISAVNGIVSTQTEALAQIKTTLARKAAGASDISLGITSAAVGDIVKVKVVDENGKPTEWEAADGSLKVIARLTTTEEVTQITLDKDIDGNDFALKEAIISLYSVGGTANTERANLLFWCNGQSTAVQRNLIQGGIPKGTESSILNTTMHIINAEYGYWYETDVKFGALKSHAAILRLLSSGEQSQLKEGISNTVKTNGINSITISVPSDKEGYTFGIGTQIIIQGVRM